MEDDEDEDEEEEEEAQKQEAQETPNPENDDTEPTSVEEKAAPKMEKVKSEPNELGEYSPDELQDVNKDVLNAEITQLEGKTQLFFVTSPLATNARFAVLEEIGKAKPNLNVLAEWRKRETEYLERARDLEQVTTSRDEAKQRYDELRKARLEGFMTGFNIISSKLKEMYQVRTFNVPVTSLG
ncbi:hypothetical protein QFC22_003459 [Naganishia vaughanmartiniae]|uniref:Uncharacterized protein n=1 Tax=Naganishia vaughanmartiniae TaxID=1424756 RepID=A0ACC2X8L4_9TREE|nr:hypothetical protein QFC22_003459 [Naganishia vaughanmartiniae]